MELLFYKYQGTGNDFIMIDDRGQIFEEDDLDLVRRLCDRKFGIGGDGLILIKEKEGFDFEMVYFNADGSQSMCGNGARCAVAFSNYLGLLSDKCRFLAIDGPHEATYNNGQVELGMSPVQQITTVGDDYFINTGSPHYVRFVEEVNGYPVVAEGARIRYSDEYKPSGTNVNFVSRISEDEIFVRTYERGVEDETLSCGTGVTACALALGSQSGKNRIRIHTPGGRLTVSFIAHPDGTFNDIILSGPATLVFKGTLDIQKR
jgi:diaminopimelate epimerase